MKKHIIFKDKSLYNAKEDYGVMMQWLLRYSISGRNPHDDVNDTMAMFAEFIQEGWNKRQMAIMRSPI